MDTFLDHSIHKKTENPEQYRMLREDLDNLTSQTNSNNDNDDSNNHSNINTSNNNNNNNNSDLTDLDITTLIDLLPSPLDITTLIDLLPSAKCDFCGVTFSDKKALGVHLISRIPGVSEANFVEIDLHEPLSNINIALPTVPDYLNTPYRKHWKSIHTHI